MLIEIVSCRQYPTLYHIFQIFHVTTPFVFTLISWNEWNPFHSNSDPSVEAIFFRVTLRVEGIGINSVKIYHIIVLNDLFHPLGCIWETLLTFTARVVAFLQSLVARWMNVPLLLFVAKQPLPWAHSIDVRQGLAGRASNWQFRDCEMSFCTRLTLLMIWE